MVHFPVVSIPVLAIAVLATAFGPAFRHKYGLPVVAWSLVTAVATYLAAESGEALKEAFQLGEADIGDHESLGKMTSLLTIGLFIFVAALVLTSRRLSNDVAGAPADKGTSVPLLGLGLVASLLAILASIWVIRTGHAGATATWEGQLPVEASDEDALSDSVESSDSAESSDGDAEPDPAAAVATDPDPAAAEVVEAAPTATLAPPTPTAVAEEPEPEAEPAAEEPAAADQADPEPEAEPEVDASEDIPAETAAVFSAADSTDPEVLAIGERRYVDSCVRCHAADGTGGRGPSLLGIAANEPDRQPHIDIIIEGGRGMPAFREALSDSEIEAVVSYIRTEFVLP